MSALETLLVLQDLDLHLDRLAHRRRTLAERATLAGTRAAMGEVALQRAAIEAQAAELSGLQARLEADIDATGRRIREIEARMYGGTVSAARELSAMAHEVESLRTRRTELEDRVIGLMEETEPLDAALAVLGARHLELEAEAARLAGLIAEAEAAIASEEATDRQARATVAGQLPQALAERYEGLRSRLGGVGAARLANGSCTGCHLTLPAIERDRIRHLPPEAVVTCEQCGRILVP